MAGERDTGGRLKALVVPHAGYSYAGETAAYAYKQIDPEKYSRVFIFGPSHHVYLKRLCISGASVLETPVGNLTVDEAVRSDLLRTGAFDVMSKRDDEEEHSLEMQLPYIAQIFGRREGITVVPINTCSLISRSPHDYAQIFMPYFKDPTNLFVISSDFCHWGHRFNYQPYDPEKGRIHEYIEWLDKSAVALIEAHDVKGFVDYINNTKNTICGRDAIKLMLDLIQQSDTSFQTRGLKYSQSSAATSMRDSSVSYVAAAVTEAH
eukprot:CAMPEP_0185018602 /NCGR_PEP_ID=MMETSP1103-20130426/1268_1 /TAXON_ID=36769 /ORGANISM="Paraphysomonas bandaiensis, Strain Caron Lab Isolate" /LENGTH=263 /DNA_ID=CAMNT_0027548459 /DNA_START=135 /DNA_END=926 /DNA_ORIENTATION=+